MFILYNCAHLGYWLSSFCNYFVGGIISFFLNKYFTFKNHEKSLLQIFLFIINLLVCYIIAYLIAKRIVYLILLAQSEKLRDNISMIVGMCLYTVLNYIGQRLIVFVEKEKKYE